MSGTRVRICVRRGRNEENSGKKSGGWWSRCWGSRWWRDDRRVLNGRAREVVAVLRLTEEGRCFERVFVGEEERETDCVPSKERIHSTRDAAEGGREEEKNSL